MDEMQGVPASVLALRSELRRNKTRRIESFVAGSECVELMLGTDSLWALILNEDGSGMALRCAWAPGTPLEIESSSPGEVVLRSAFGVYRINVSLPDKNDCLVRVTTRLTPAQNLSVPWWPRDLYPLGKGADPLLAKGEVFAAQRGLNTGLVYGRLDSQGGRSFFYLQNFTPLNPFFRLTATKPDGVVGGIWPELGYQAQPLTKPLPAGQEIVISDAFLRLDGVVLPDRQAEGRSFLEHLAAIYPFLDKPELGMRDWPQKAAATVKDLSESPFATVKNGGYRFVRPYVNGGVPDSMAQMSVLGMIEEYRRWCGEELPVRDELRAGIYRFFDPDESSFTGFLSTMPPPEDEGLVDSWYLYHPLKGLASLAKSGDTGARGLFLDSLAHAIRVAQHFAYEWPIKFNRQTLEITRSESKPGESGQTDTGGLYAFVMLDAYELTGDRLYLEEAEKAIRATRHLGFQLAYQTNLTSWGAAACLRLWKANGDPFFRDQSLAFLASFFHNCAVWESAIGKVDMTIMFLGVTCLKDGPYMAPFECYESFCAFFSALMAIEGDETFPDAARLMMAEFCRYALERAWWFYPSSLPETALARDPKTGNIVRSLAFPVEDLYVDGRAAGEIGQEVYGAGAAIAYATRAFHRLGGGRMLFCDHPIRDLEITGKGATFRLCGPAGSKCQLRVLPPSGVEAKIGRKKADATRFEAEVGSEVRLSW